MTVQPDHELEVLEDDQTVPPRPEEVIADAARAAVGGPAEEVGEGASATAPETVS